MKTRKSAIAGTALALIAASPAWGAAISVNYDIAGGNTPSLASADVAGVVPVDNWNNLEAPGVGQPFNYGMTYVNDSAAPTSLTVSATSGTADTWNTAGTPDEIIFGDKANMINTTTLSLGSVPYSSYDLYIYSSEWGNEVVNFTIGGDTQTLTNTFTPQFTAGDNLVLNDTYVKFTGLSGDVDVNMTVTSGGLHLGGFQIVDAIPEPSSSLLLGMAGMVVAFRRRRA